MPRKKHSRRSLSEIYALGKDIGDDRVLLNEAEMGAVLAGDDDTPLSAGTVCNMRYDGRLFISMVRVGRTPKFRLSSVIEYINSIEEKPEATTWASDRRRIDWDNRMRRRG